MVVPKATFSYDYQSNSSQPPAGKCYQPSSAPAQISFSYTDNNTNDNTALLTGLVVGDQIIGNGITWAITAITPRGSNILFTVNPAVAAPPYGVTDFGFGQQPSEAAVIAAGESLSSAVDITSKAVVMVIAPPDWSPANITFQVSADGVTFADLFDVNAQEVLRAIRPGAAMLVDSAVTKYVKAIKVRSGPRDNPVPQEFDRVITLVMTPV